ncbi:oligosaccharide flippase family protein [Chroococcidiopsis sp. CCMEE 29]|uniref:lipopolysaccharide biosynthesis protein n=1 Tax=Chroococcidiopsis sp. CCMEE 29 TaxID=155894 RepID=UPI0020219D85|nr:oligosaccharide flippase family protein [Chroococcidiopsis sp. CCMEE 29]
MSKFFHLWLKRYSQVKWVLADQIMVSGMNFLTGVLLARFLGVESYGQFVLLYAVLLYVNVLQVALIIAPMISIAPQISSDAERNKYFKGLITLQLLSSFILSIIIFSGGQVVEKHYHLWNVDVNILLPLTTTILFFQLQDWLRRYYFVCRKGKAVFINDGISYGGQIALLILLYRLGSLSIANAFWAIALSSAIAFLIGILTEKIWPVLGYALPALRRSWQFGRDLLLSGQIYWASSQGILIFGATILGAKAAGGIRAAQNIVGPINILFQGMENIIPIQAAQHYGQHQLPGLKNYLKKVSLLGGLLLAVPCVIIACFSQQLIELAYGESYADYGTLIVWQVIIAFIGFFRLQAFYFFRTIGCTKEILLNTIVASIVAFIFTGVFVYRLQETGIMLALVFSEAAGLIFALKAARKYFDKVK